MDYIKALGIKFIFTTVAVLSLFGIFFQTSIWTLLMFSVIVTGLAYIIGDLFVLPRFGMIPAVLADAVLVFGTLYFLGNMFIETSFSMLLTSLAAAFFLSFTEGLFHIYMKEQVFGERVARDRPMLHNQVIQTEFAEEVDAEDVLHRQQNKQDQ